MFDERISRGLIEESNGRLTKAHEEDLDCLCSQLERRGVQTDRVWLHRSDPGQPMAVGLALPADDTSWQRFVDNLQVDLLLN